MEKEEQGRGKSSWHCEKIFTRHNYTGMAVHWCSARKMIPVTKVTILNFVKVYNFQVENHKLYNAPLKNLNRN
jgi:hypothetical protein